MKTCVCFYTHLQHNLLNIYRGGGMVFMIVEQIGCYVYIYKFLYSAITMV
jgi:hypothetical protein